MANRNDVVLTIKANDLGTPTLEKLKTLLGQVTTAQDALAKASGNADEALAGLTDQQKQLGEALKPLAGLQAVAQRLIGTGQEIAAKRAQVESLKTSVADLTKEIDAAGGKGTTQQNSALRRLESDAKRAQAQLDKLKLTAAGLSDKLEQAGLSRSAGRALGQINTTGRQVLGAQSAVSTNIEQLNQAKARQAEITAEVQRRAQIEQQAQQRAVEAARQLALINQQRRDRLGRAVDVFSAGPTPYELRQQKDYQAEITAEVKRRAQIEQDAAARQKAALDQQLADYQRISQKRADSIAAFSSIPSEAQLRVASANESAKLAAQARKTAAEVAASQKKEASAAQESASVFAQMSDRKIAAAAKEAAAMRQAGATTAEILSRAQEVPRSAQAYKALGLAFDETGKASNKAAKGFSVFRDEGRTTLSLVQRIRGQILSLTAAYVGVFGAVDQFNKIIEAGKGEQAAKAQLSLVVGDDPAKIAQTYAYLRQEADRTGQSFDVVSQGYTKLAISAKKYGLTQAETNKLFGDILTTARALGLNAQQTNEALLAIQQGFDKTKIQSQEVRLQLGNSGLSGVIQALAATFPGLNGDVGKFNKELEQGQIPARAYLLAFDKLAKDSLPSFKKQVDSTEAAQNRFNNAIGDLRRAFADSGFLDAFTNALKDLTAKFEDPQFRDSVRQLGVLMGDLVKAVVAVTTNTDLLRVAAEALGLFFSYKLLSAVGGAITAFKGLNVAVLTTEVSMKSLTGIFGVLTAAFAGWEIGKFLNKFALIQRSADSLFGSLFATGDALKHFAEGDFKGGVAILKEQSSRDIDNTLHPFTPLGGGTSSGNTPANGSFLNAGPSNPVPGAGNSALGLALGSSDPTIVATARQKIIDEQKVNDAEALNKKLLDLQTSLNEKKAESDKDYVAKYRAQYADLLQQAQDYATKYGDKSQLDKVNGLIKQLAALDASKDGKKVVDKAKQLAQSLGSQLSSVVQEIAAGQKQIVLTSSKEIDAYIARQSASINQKYALLIAKIKKIGNNTIDIGDGRQLNQSQALAAVQQAKAIEEAAARTAAYQQAINQQKEQTSKLEQAQAAEISAVNAKVETGLIGEYQGKVEILKIQDKYRASIIDSVDKTRELLEALKKGSADDKNLFEKLGGDALLAQLDAIKTKTSQVDTIWTSAFKKFKTDLAGGATDAIITFGKGLAGVISGANSLGQAFQGALKSFREFAANFLEQIAQMILQTYILKAIQSSIGGGGGIGGALFGLFNGGSSSFFSPSGHTGGPVSAMPGSRLAMAGWFDNAPRYHTGGIVGLRPNEVPIIAKKGEEVLSEGDPRNVLNGGGRNITPAAGANVKIVNTIDSESFVQQGLATQGGQQTLFNVMRANRNQVRNILGIR